MCKKILITGGNGFVAKHCEEYFKDRYIVYAPTKYELDVTSLKNLRQWFVWNNNIDYVIHAATYDADPTFSDKARNRQFVNNMQMFINLTQCQDSFNRMIYFGSGAELYRGKDDVNPEYSLSKSVMTEYIKITDNNIFNLRLFVVLGEYADWRYRVPANLLCKALFDKKLIIPENKIISYIDINDLVRMIELVLNKDKLNSKVYDCIKTNVTNYDLIAKKILKVSNKNLDIELNNSLSIKSYTGNNSCFINEFENFEFTLLNNTIKRLWQYYKEHKDQIDINKFEY